MSPAPTGRPHGASSAAHNGTRPKQPRSAGAGSSTPPPPAPPPPYLGDSASAPPTGLATQGLLDELRLQQERLLQLHQQRNTAQGALNNQGHGHGMLAAFLDQNLSGPAPPRASARTTSASLVDGRRGPGAGVSAEEDVDEEEDDGDGDEEDDAALAAAAAAIPPPQALLTSLACLQQKLQRMKQFQPPPPGERSIDDLCDYDEELRRNLAATTTVTPAGDIAALHNEKLKLLNKLREQENKKRQMEHLMRNLSVGQEEVERQAQKSEELREVTGRLRELQNMIGSMDARPYVEEPAPTGSERGGHGNGSSTVCSMIGYDDTASRDAGDEEEDVAQLLSNVQEELKRQKLQRTKEWELTSNLAHQLQKQQQHPPPPIRQRQKKNDLQSSSSRLSRRTASKASCSGTVSAATWSPLNGSHSLQSPPQLRLSQQHLRSAAASQADSDGASSYSNLFSVSGGLTETVAATGSGTTATQQDRMQDDVNSADRQMRSLQSQIDTLNMAIRRLSQAPAAAPMVASSAPASSARPASVATAAPAAHVLAAAANSNDFSNHHQNVSLFAVIQQQQQQLQQLSQSVTQCFQAHLLTQRDIVSLQRSVEKLSQQLAEQQQERDCSSSRQQQQQQQQQQPRQQQQQQRHHQHNTNAVNTNSAVLGRQGAGGSSGYDPWHMGDVDFDLVFDRSVPLDHPNWLADPWGSQNNPGSHQHHFNQLGTAAAAAAAAAERESEVALNNQLPPPGMRANNYWDNFRSFSRQNRFSSSSGAGAMAHMTQQHPLAAATGATPATAVAALPPHSSVAAAAATMITAPTVPQPHSAAAAPGTVSGAVATGSSTAPNVAQVTPRQIQSLSSLQDGSTAAAATAQPQRTIQHALIEPTNINSLNSPPRPRRKQKINREQNREQNREVSAESSSSTAAANIFHSSSANSNAGAGSMNRTNGAAESASQQQQQAVMVFPMPQNQNRNLNRDPAAAGAGAQPQTSSTDGASATATVNPVVSSLTMSIYSQINSLVSQHEQRPEQLARIFHDLQMFSANSNDGGSVYGNGNSRNHYQDLNDWTAPPASAEAALPASAARGVETSSRHSSNFLLFDDANNATATSSAGASGNSSSSNRSTPRASVPNQRPMARAIATPTPASFASVIPSASESSPKLSRDKRLCLANVSSGSNQERSSSNTFVPPDAAAASSSSLSFRTGPSFGQNSEASALFSIHNSFSESADVQGRVTDNLLERDQLQPAANNSAASLFVTENNRPEQDRGQNSDAFSSYNNVAVPKNIQRNIISKERDLRRIRPIEPRNMSVPTSAPTPASSSLGVNMEEGVGASGQAEKDVDAGEVNALAANANQAEEVQATSEEEQAGAVGGFVHVQLQFAPGVAEAEAVVDGAAALPAATAEGSHGGDQGTTSQNDDDRVSEMAEADQDQSTSATSSPEKLSAGAAGCFQRMPAAMVALASPQSSPFDLASDTNVPSRIQAEEEIGGAAAETFGEVDEHRGADRERQDTDADSVRIHNVDDDDDLGSGLDRVPTRLSAHDLEEQRKAEEAANVQNLIEEVLNSSSSSSLSSESYVPPTPSRLQRRQVRDGDDDDDQNNPQQEQEEQQSQEQQQFALTKN